MTESDISVLAARLDDFKQDIKEDILGLRTDIADYRKETVGRGEWSQRNNHVDERFRHTDDKFNAQGREIAQIRTDNNTSIAKLETEIAQRRAPWWSVGSLITSIIAVLIAASTIIQR